MSDWGRATHDTSARTTLVLMCVLAALAIGMLKLTSEDVYSAVKARAEVPGQMAEGETE